MRANGRSCYGRRQWIVFTRRRESMHDRVIEKKVWYRLVAKTRDWSTSNGVGGDFWVHAALEENILIYNTHE